MRSFFVFILLAFIILRISVYFSQQPKFPDGTKIKITDRVNSEPIRYSNSQYLKILEFKIYLPSYPEVSYGDNIVIEGVVKGDELKQVKLVSVTQSASQLYKLRKSIIGFYLGSLPQPHSSLIAGVTLGSKASIPKDFWDGLKKTGTAHVVVASGMNVVLVANFLISSLVLFLSRRKALVLAFAGIWSYSLLSGFDAPIIRAAIMGSLTFTAQEIGRLNLAWRALLFSAFVMLLINPGWITDLGFVLSFIATASLMMLQPGIKRKIGFVPDILREDLSTSLAAQIGVAPILFYSFGQFNILSPLINTAVLWTIVPITILGMAAGILGLFYTPLGIALLWLTYPLTSWFIWIVRIFN